MSATQLILAAKSIKTLYTQKQPTYASHLQLFQDMAAVKDSEQWVPIVLYHSAAVKAAPHCLDGQAGT